MADIIQVRRDLAANWTSANPILAQGELGLETDTIKIKYGDGSTAWNSLGYFVAAADGKVGIDSGATPDYLGAANSDGALRTDASLGYTDGGDFVTLSLDSTLKSNYDAAFTHVSADGSSHADVVTNSAKNTNVPTALEIGTVGINTVAITSDGGADDVTLPAALVDAAGMLTTAKWAEIVTNSLHTANNSQAHNDYLTNTGNDETTGVLTAAGFTVGSTQLTDGVITDATGLSLVADILITGNFTINNNTSSLFILDNASNNTVEGILTLRRTTSGTAASGLGGSLVWHVDNDAGIFKGAAWINAFLTDTTDGAEQAGMTLNVRGKNGAIAIAHLGEVDIPVSLTAGTIQADNGFTGTGAYTNFTITGGIITAAS